MKLRYLDNKVHAHIREKNVTQNIFSLMWELGTLSKPLRLAVFFDVTTRHKNEKGHFEEPSRSLRGLDVWRRFVFKGGRGTGKVTVVTEDKLTAAAEVGHIGGTVLENTFAGGNATRQLGLFTFMRSRPCDSSVWSRGINGHLLRVCANTKPFRREYARRPATLLSTRSFSFCKAPIKKIAGVFMPAQIVPFPGVRPDASRKSPLSENKSSLYPADLLVDQARHLLTAELKVIHSTPQHMQAEAVGSALLLASRMLLELSICLQNDKVKVHWPMRREVRS